MYIIAITGKTCSGKTSLSKKIQTSLGEDECLLISMDDFYKELSAEEKKETRNDDSIINVDTPNSIEFDLLKSTLIALKSPSTREVRLPKYDAEKCLISSWTNVSAPKYKFVIVEGLFILNDPELRKFFDLKVWVETSDYVCALRLFMKFSFLLKTYSQDLIYDQCIRNVIPGQEKYIKPLRNFCDFFVNGEIENNSSVSMVSNYIMKPDS